MPNWCSNTLTVTGDDHLVTQFADRVKTVIPAETSALVSRQARTHLLDLAKVMPVPDGLSEDERYTWRVNNWGTKWSPGAADVVVDDGPGVRVYSFDTAWSPLGPRFMAKLAEVFPSLNFSLFAQEPGNLIEVQATVVLGELVDYDEREMQTQDDDFNYAADDETDEELQGSDDPLEN